MADYDVKPHPDGGCWHVARRGHGRPASTCYATCAAAQTAAWLLVGAEGGMVFVHGHARSGVVSGSRRHRAALLAVAALLVVRPRRLPSRRAA
jgi:Uncharacterized protein conserved in bacteria (DUF2188)